MVGGPEWMNKTRFDLEARMDRSTTSVQLPVLIRRLLDARFGLRSHVEQRALDVFVLTVAQPGKLGPGLMPVPPACVIWRKDGGPVPDECNLRRHGEMGGMTLVAVTMTEFITALSMKASLGLPTAIDRPVVDRTDLEGQFQIVGPSPYPEGAGRAGSPEPAVGSFFTLMQEQLGLKLTRAREMVDVLVIDSATMPEPN